ncbi:LysR family transcriptional regulator [Lignipirellula cremea]|uniref:HTH-type transcriptional activator CmpR n=1 Tax=Lignipirellula cremea TaxID=2528010 RepID=A0A518DRS1_9BACT|nr:LysR family transcriptional regulator [Lignipirellula cremea]QDU94545.1 HTH-type transcriptional activator CmpR [Lignipirellula cremea]
MTASRYYKEVRFEHFRTFSEVARSGSFAAAGRVLGLSRPTVWQQVHSLEMEFAVKLFSRQGRGVETTEPGRVLLDLILPSIAAMDSVGDAFRARLAGPHGVVRLASISGNDLLFRAISRLPQQSPPVQFTWVEQRGVDGVDLVESGQCDLGLVLTAPETRVNPRVHYEPCGQRSFTLAAPADHPLLHKRTLSLKQLVEHRLVTFPLESPFRRYVDQVFARADLLGQMQIAAEAETIETAEHCVQLGLGVALVLPSCTHAAPTGLAYRRLDKLFGSGLLHLVWERGAHLRPPVATFVELVKELLAA